MDDMDYSGELETIAADLREALDDGDDSAIAAALKAAISHCLDEEGYTISVKKG